MSITATATAGGGSAIAIAAADTRASFSCERLLGSLQQSYS